MEEIPTLYPARTSTDEALPCTGRRGRAALLAPLGIVVVGGLALFLDAAEQGGMTQPLHASEFEVADADADGIPDRQEIILKTDPFLPDSDFDGFSDGEELALQTDPSLYDDFPEDLVLSVGMTARAEAGKLKLFSAVHIPDGVTDNKVIRFGALVGGEVVKLHMGRLAPYMVTTEQDSPNGGKLLTFDIHLPVEYVKMYGQATFFAVVGVTGESRYASAAKADLDLIRGIMMLRVPKEYGAPTAVPHGAFYHHPIPIDGEVSIPTDWESGKVCFQMSEVVGVTGSTVTHQVVEASCESGWDTYCESDCEMTVGTTFTTIDPGSLLGG